MRSFHVDAANRATISKIIKENVSLESTLNTDESGNYIAIGREMAGHKVVKHGLHEYVKDGATTNTVEGYYSIFKKGMKGIYQHCDERHLHRYVAEFDFRDNNRTALGVDDDGRTREALKGISGKRLTYNQTH